MRVAVLLAGVSFLALAVLALPAASRAGESPPAGPSEAEAQSRRHKLRSRASQWRQRRSGMPIVYPQCRGTGRVPRRGPVVEGHEETVANARSVPREIRAWLEQARPFHERGAGDVTAGRGVRMQDRLRVNTLHFRAHRRFESVERLLADVLVSDTDRPRRRP